jgi:hypothetical protein
MTTAAWRVPLGFLLSPVVPCTCLTWAFAGTSGQWGTIMVMVLACWAISAVFAVPTYLFLRRFKRIAWVDCIIGGAMSALAFNLVGFALTQAVSGGRGYSASDAGGATVVDGHMTIHGLVSLAEGLLPQAMLGACIGACFWFIALRESRVRRQSRA